MSDTAARPQRSDAARNRARLLEAAAAVFAERGLEASVTEIAARAEVGRGTLFRNFPTKEDLIAAIVVEKMRQGIAVGRALLAAAAPDDGSVVFAFMEEIAKRQQNDRALFESVSEEFMSNPEIHGAHDEFVGLLDELLVHGQTAGVVRPEVGAMDLMMLIKGVCAAAAALEATPEMLERHLDFVRAAIAAPGYTVAVRGVAPTVEDIQRHLKPAAADPAAAA